MTKNESVNEELIQIRAHELNFLRKLASERRDAMIKLEADLETVRKLCAALQSDYNDLCKVKSTEAAKLSTELAEAKKGRDAAQEAANKLIAELAVARGERDEFRTMNAAARAEREAVQKHWEVQFDALQALTAKCEELRAERHVAERDRASRDAALSRRYTELETLRADLASERQERIEWQGSAKGLEKELEIVRAGLTQEEAANNAKHEELTEAWDDRDAARREAHSLHAELTTVRTELEETKASDGRIISSLYRDIDTLREALSKLEQAAREAHRVMSDHESMDLDAAMDAAVVMIERALPAAAEQTSGPLITNSQGKPDPNGKCWMVEANDASQVAPAPDAAADLKARVRAAAEEASKHWQPPATPTHDAAERELHYKAAILDELPGDPDNPFDTVAQLKRRKEQKRADAARVATERERARCLAAQPPAEVYGWGQETILLWRERIASGEPAK